MTVHDVTVTNRLVHRGDGVGQTLAKAIGVKIDKGMPPVFHTPLIHLILECTSVHPPVLLVLILLRVEHTRHTLDVVQPIYVSRGHGLGPNDQVGKDGVVVCSTRLVEEGEV